MGRRVRVPEIEVRWWSQKKTSCFDCGYLNTMIPRVAYFYGDLMIDEECYL